MSNLIKTVDQIKERIAKLKSNVALIKNEEGKKNILEEIKVMEDYLSNPFNDFKELIKKANSKVKAQTLKWIGGLAV